MDNQKKEMVTEQQRKICPACTDGHLSRIHRESWMTWLPSSKYYSCSKCKAHYLRIFDMFQFNVKMGGKNSKTIKRELAILALVIVLTVYVCWRLVINLY